MRTWLYRIVTNALENSSRRPLPSGPAAARHLPAWQRAVLIPRDVLR